MPYVFAPPSTYEHRSPDLRVCFMRDGVFDFSLSADALANRVRVDAVTAGLDDDFPRATISVRTAGLREGGVNLQDELRLGDLDALISPDVRLVVFAELPGTEADGGAGSRQFLFDGYPTVPDVEFNGLPGQEGISLRLLCTSMLERLAKEKETQIWGRYMWYPAGQAVEHVESLICVFNKDGRPNRDPVLRDHGGAINLPVFTWDGNPAAKYWTYADVLTYLNWFWFTHPLGSSYPIQDGNGLALCADFRGLDPVPLGALGVPDFESIVKTKCDELLVEGKNIVAAWLMWSRLCGFNFQQYTFADTSPDSLGQPITRVLFSPIGSGGPWTAESAAGRTERAVRTDLSEDAPAPFSLKLEKAGTPVANRTGADVLAANEVAAARLTFDSEAIVNSCRVIGEPERYEVTIGRRTGLAAILPGWLPDAQFGDNTEPGSALSLKLAEIAALTPTMESRYTVRGATFLQYQTVGRVWVLNEDGAYGAAYGRTGAQSDAYRAAAYTTIFDWHNAVIGPGVPPRINRGDGLRTLRWIPRPRRCLPLVSTAPGDIETKPILEASFDGGASWGRYPGNYRFLDDRIGVILTDMNLGAVYGPAPAALSVWAAIVSGTFRLAITCCVEGDARLIGEGADPGSWITLSSHKLLHVQGDAKFRSRTGANSILKSASGYGGQDIDDTAQADALAYKFLSVSSPRRVAARVTIPYLTKAWLPADLCSGIMPAGVSFLGNKGSAGRFPQVVKVAWHNSPEGSLTTLQLEDRRLESRIV